MKISLDLNKTVEENAAKYFEKSKKSKKKIQGVEETIQRFKKKYAAEEKKEREKKIVGKRVQHKEKKWFEKFRWSLTSSGFLLISGRDATTNEILIKKYTDKEDMVFHADMAGSPFTVLKSNKKTKDEQSLAEAAEMTATNSRAWKMGLASLEVFYVDPEQVTKQAKAGEYMSKGSFMVYGRRHHINTKLECFIGKITKGKTEVEKIEDFKDKIMAGSKEAVDKYCETSIHLIQGGKKASDIAKKIQKLIGGELDEIIRALPPGNCDIMR